MVKIADADAPPSSGKDARSSKQQHGGNCHQKRKSGTTSPTDNTQQQDGGKLSITPSDKTADKEEKSKLPPKQPQTVPIPAST
eukprot:7590556-Ditylum_brightwellii.AAC.1